MFDKDLAALYEVPTKKFNQQVKRNIKRFPSDFMFQLTKEETEVWFSQIAISNKSSRSQFATLKKGQNVKYLPYVFTEQGVAMLSSVLNSDRAIEVNIQIMRVFTKLREMMISHKDLVHKIEDLERKFQYHDRKIIQIFNTIRQMMAVPDPAAPYRRSKIGFLADKGKAE